MNDAIRSACGGQLPVHAMTSRDVLEVMLQCLLAAGLLAVVTVAELDDRLVLVGEGVRHAGIPGGTRVHGMDDTILPAIPSVIMGGGE